MQDFEEIHYIENLTSHQEETILLMGNQEWCEKTVVLEFLNRLTINYSENELEYVPQKYQPPDVKFRDANFEVTSLLIKRKPDQEAKQRLLKLKQARYLKDTFIPINWPQKITFTEIIKLVFLELEKKKNEYPSIKGKNILDILIDFMEQRFPHIESDFLIPNDIISQGWRSVSVVISSYAIVLYANSSAPIFLNENERVLELSNSLEWRNAPKE